MASLQARSRSARVGMMQRHVSKAVKFHPRLPHTLSHMQPGGDANRYMGQDVDLVMLTVTCGRETALLAEGRARRGLSRRALAASWPATILAMLPSLHRRSRPEPS